MVHTYFYDSVKIYNIIYFLHILMGIVLQSALISPSFLKDIFNWHRTLGWQLFNFSTWKNVCHFLLTSVVSDKISAAFLLPTLPTSHFFSLPSFLFWLPSLPFFFSFVPSFPFSLPLSALKIFSFSFQKFYSDVSWSGFLWIYPIWEIFSASWIFSFMYFFGTNSGKVPGIVNLNTLQPYSFFSSGNPVTRLLNLLP